MKHPRLVSVSFPPNYHVMCADEFRLAFLCVFVSARAKLSPLTSCIQMRRCWRNACVWVVLCPAVCPDGWPENCRAEGMKGRAMAGEERWPTPKEVTSDERHYAWEVAADMAWQIVVHFGFTFSTINSMVDVTIFGYSSYLQPTIKPVVKDILYRYEIEIAFHFFWTRFLFCWIWTSCSLFWSLEL